MYSFWSNAAANYIIEEDNISTIGYIRSHRTVSVSLQNNFKFVYKGNLCRKLTYEVRRSWERNFVATKCRVRGKLRTYVLLSVTQLFNPWNFKYTVMNSVRWMKTFPTLEHDCFCHSVYTKVFNRSYLAQYAAKTFETC